MPVIIGLILVVLGYYILYSIVKAAVRDGIRETQKPMEPLINLDSMAVIACPRCNKRHEMDDPKCPYCGYVRMEL